MVQGTILLALVTNVGICCYAHSLYISSLYARYWVVLIFITVSCHLVTTDIFIVN
jgi:hypothetical protein